MRSFGLLTDEELKNSPSRQDGLSAAVTHEYSRSSCSFIGKIADRLKLRLISKSTALVFFHRFFARQSFASHDRWVVAMTCVFLASKVEEDIRKLKEVIVAGHKVKTGKELDDKSDMYKRLVDKVLVCERILLHTLSFDVSVEHPHNDSLRYVKEVGGGSDLKQTAWNFLNDSLNTKLCLCYTAQQIAAAGVMLAAYYLKNRSESSSKLSRAALQQFDQMYEKDGKIFGHDAHLLKSIVNEMLKVYQKVKLSGEDIEQIKGTRP
mmetsp:Transcript_5365/g.7100  ORF Transcript_5365/g.7100 Transcript_5365/m.7100 type:complete len:264 (-) Transcript_5365:258-1049(-)